MALWSMSAVFLFFRGLPLKNMALIILSILLLVFQIKNAMVARRAIAGVARHALRRGGIARLPATDEVRLTDKGTRKADVLYLCIVEELVNLLDRAQTTHQHDGAIDVGRQGHGRSTEVTLVFSCLDARARRSCVPIGSKRFAITVGTHFDGVDARVVHQSAGQHEVLCGQSAGVLVGGVDFHRDEEVGTGLAAHVLLNFVEYATAPPQVAAVAVGAVVQ